jgi:hypothetical protein
MSVNRKKRRSDKVRVLRPSPYVASTDPSPAAGSLTSCSPRLRADVARRGQFPDQMATAAHSLQGAEMG